MKRTLFTAVLMSTLCTIGLTQSTQTPDRTEYQTRRSCRHDSHLWRPEDSWLADPTSRTTRCDPEPCPTVGCSRDDTNKRARKKISLEYRREVIEARLKDTTNQEALRELCAPDVIYVSLNHSKAIRKAEKWKCEQRTVTTGVK